MNKKLSSKDKSKKRADSEFFKEVKEWRFKYKKSAINKYYKIMEGHDPIEVEVVGEYSHCSMDWEFINLGDFISQA